MGLETLPQSDGAFLKEHIDLINRNVAKTATKDDAQTLTNKTLTAPVINGAVTGTAFGDRVPKTSVTAIAGAALHAGVLNWQNPESVSVIVTRVYLLVETVATGACTVDVGVTASSATTASDTLLDGVDVNAATGVFDSMNAALDSGANAKAQLVAAGKWVTVKEASGDATGLVAKLIVEYVLTA